MSRCRACDRIMTEFEMTRKFKDSGMYVDLCNKCFNSCTYPPVAERYDLLKTEDIEDDSDLCETSTMSEMYSIDNLENG